LLQAGTTPTEVIPQSPVPLGLAPEAAPAPRGRYWPAVGRTLAWLIPAVAMLVAGQWGIARPVLGWDEMATWSAAQRPVPKIISLIENIDGVLAPWYLFMHWWMGVFGDSHVALRAPALIAMTISAALVARLGTRLLGPTGGLIAGLLFVAMPSVNRYAQDARPYGLVVLFATLSTLLLLRAVERPGWPRWLPYALGVVFLGLSNVLALLLVVGHAVLVGWRFAQVRQRRLLLWWGAAAGAGVLPALPLLWLAMPQHDAMLDWIHVYDWRVAVAAPGDIFGTTVVGLFVLGLALLARPRERHLFAGLVAMAVVPPAALLLASIGSHVWVPRYVLYTVAFWALLAAYALRNVPVRAVIAVALAAAVAMPAQVELRGVTTHIGPDNRLAATILRAHAQPGDAILYAKADLWSTRNGIEYYLGDQAPRDVLLYRSRVVNDSLLDTDCPDAAACIGDTQRLWLYRCADEWQGLSHIGDAEQFMRFNTHLAEKYDMTGCSLRLYVRNSAPLRWPPEPTTLRDPDLTSD
jgi:mannosyltransferase